MHILSRRSDCLNHLSIDTIRVVIPTADPLIHMKFVPNGSYMKFKPDGAPDYEVMSHYFWPADLWDNLPSGWTPMSFKCRGSDLFLQFSLPKLLYGHSARHAYLDQLLPTLWAIMDYLCSEWHVPIMSPPEEWRLNRVDVSYNFLAPTPQDAENAYKSLSFMRFMGKLGINHGRKQLAYWPGRARTIKFYLKGPEMKRSGDYDKEWLQVNEFDLNRIVRYEEEWKQQYLRRFCNVQSAMDITVERFIKTAVRRRPPADFLRLMRSQFTDRFRSINITESVERIQTLRQSKRYLYFYYMVLDRGLENVRLSMPNRNKFYRYKSKLSKLGVELDIAENLMLQEFRPFIGNDISGIFDNNFCTLYDELYFINDHLYNAFRMRYKKYYQLEKSDILTV